MDRVGFWCEFYHRWQLLCNTWSPDLPTKRRLPPRNSVLDFSLCRGKPSQQLLSSCFVFVAVQPIDSHAVTAIVQHFPHESGSPVALDLLLHLFQICHPLRTDQRFHIIFKLSQQQKAIISNNSCGLYSTKDIKGLTRTATLMFSDFAAFAITECPQSCAS